VAGKQAAHGLPFDKLRVNSAQGDNRKTQEARLADVDMPVGLAVELETRVSGKEDAFDAGDVDR